MEQYWVEVMKVIEGALRLDLQKVKNYSEFLAQKLAEDGEERVASRILKLLEAASKTSVQPASALISSRLPLDQDSRLPLADVSQPDGIDTTLVLNPDQREELERFLVYRQNSSRLASAGLPIPGTLLLYGPPGCGKTQMAKYVAKKLGLPLVTARLDSIVSSFLGNTAKNIRAVFEYAERTPCVLLLDEFDALAKLRDDANELGELKRVVNSLLQNIDALSNDTIVIAATNHEHLLDPAIWRRFEFRIEVPKPGQGSRTELIRAFLDPTGWSTDQFTMSAIMTDGLSGADIKHICIEARRGAFVEFRTASTLSDFTRSFIRYKLLTGSTGLSSLQERVEYLRSLDPRLFSYAAIAECMGTSKALVGKILREGPKGDARREETAADQTNPAP